MLSVCQLRFELRTNESASIGTARGGIKWVSPMFASTVEAKSRAKKGAPKIIRHNLTGTVEVFLACGSLHRVSG
jgi:hypothetical protein